MEEISIKLPEELKELALMKKINWQLLVARKLNEELEELARLKRIVSKSKLTEEDAQELTDETNMALALKYNCGIFSGDKGLKEQTKVEVFSPRQLLDILGIE